VPAYLVFFTCLVAITVIDFQLQIIPNRIVYPTIFASVPLLALAALARGDWDRFGEALLGATLAWLALLVLHLISPAGMGFGDVRLAFVLGLFLGWIDLGHVITGLFLGVLLIAVVGIVLAALRLRSIQEHIAFGPFLAAGSTVAVFAGNAIIKWWAG
jgi:leader peptidase (prepilin peptidase) / N-methyltransferase